jgi:hypothetical protein
VAVPSQNAENIESDSQELSAPEDAPEQVLPKLQVIAAYARLSWPPGDWTPATEKCIAGKECMIR